MGHNFLPYEPNQMLLLPPSLDEWVPADSLARFVSETVDELHRRGRLKSVFAKYRDDGWGRAAYDPRMMLKVLLYAYCHGLTSSRKIARALENDVCLRYLSGNQQPDFRTISDFRRKHLQNFQTLFAEVLELCTEAGLTKMGRVALDGRRVAANASRGKNRSEKALRRERDRLKRAVREILEEAERIDAEEDKLYKDRRGDELPKDLRSAEGRLKRIQECLDRLEGKEKERQQEYEQRLKEREEKEKSEGRKLRGQKPKPPKERPQRAPAANPTDPDSRIMKLQGGNWIQAFNGQAMADCESQVIVAQGLTNEENDHHQLEPMLRAVVEQSGRRPGALLADAGYCNDANLRLEDEKTELFIACSKARKQRRRPQEEGAPKGRIPNDATPLDLMKRKLRTKRGKRIYKSRSPSIEGVFGQMWTRGLTRFRLRGLKQVQDEWALWCTSHNLMKLFRGGWTPAR